MRQGAAADRTAFGKRLWRLGQDARPGAVLLLVPDEIRLRQARRLLDAAPFVGFLALEEEASKAGVNSPVWYAPSGGVPLSLREVLAYAVPAGSCPSSRRLAVPGCPPTSTRYRPGRRYPAGCCPCS